MSAPTLTPGQFLMSDAPESEKRVVEWQFHLCGGFFSALWEAIQRADHENLARIEKGFPDHVAGFKAWAHGDLGERLKEAGLPI